MGLDYLSLREGWDTVKPWSDVLSLGEQQALGIARLLFANPQYAVLDECLSAVSANMQAVVYKALAERSIATVAIMHEVSEAAAPYFSQELKLGEPVANGWQLEELVPPDEQSVRDVKVSGNQAGLGGAEPVDLSACAEAVAAPMVAPLEL